jgi:aspartyl-tRNA(Asn)/glutamyl-tRNA(Gln) amidotransferase subunit A
MARTVEDVAIMLKIIAGPDPMDQFSARVAAQDYPQQLKRSIRGLRVGVLSQPEMKGFHADTQKAFLDAVKVLESQGAQIKEVTFNENTHIAAESHGIIRICEAATYHRQYLRKQETEYRHIWSNDPNDSNTRITVEAGMLLTSSQYLKAQQARKLFMEEFYKIYNTLDVFLDPTMPSPADVPAPGAEGYRNWFDLNGFPAVSLPCGFSSNPRGLPIGLQISAKPFQDSLVLAVANAFEQATEWHKRRPAI